MISDWHVNILGNYLFCEFELAVVDPDFDPPMAKSDEERLELFRTVIIMLIILNKNNSNNIMTIFINLHLKNCHHRLLLSKTSCGRRPNRV